MANAKKPVAGAAPKQKRRSPITRAEGEQRLIDASIELLLERPFKEVGVRDIALRADVNHGFVHTWFGSKEGLFIAALKQVLATIAGNVTAMPGSQMATVPFDPHTQLAIKLTTWLKLEGPRRALRDATGHAARRRDDRLEAGRVLHHGRGHVR
jgi:AcrR family transcriptional regulator